MPSPAAPDRRRSDGGAIIDAPRTDAPKIDDSAAAIVQRLLTNLGALAQAYVDLAREEARGTVRDLVRSLVLLALAAVVGAYVVGLGLLTVVFALSLTMRLWLAALITFVGAALVAAVLVAIGLRGLKARRLSALAAQMRSDLQWLREAIRKNI